MNSHQTQRRGTKLAAITDAPILFVEPAVGDGMPLMGLNEVLEKMRESSWGKWPGEQRAIVERANRDLERSGILDRIVQVGERAPDFTLRDAGGATVTLSDLLKTGPVVLSFYRGHW